MIKCRTALNGCRHSDQANRLGLSVRQLLSSSPTTARNRTLILPFCEGFKMKAESTWALQKKMCSPDPRLYISVMVSTVALKPRRSCTTATWRYSQLITDNSHTTRSRVWSHHRPRLVRMTGRGAAFSQKLRVSILHSSLPPFLSCLLYTSPSPRDS